MTGFSRDFGSAVRVGDRATAVIDGCSFVSNSVSNANATIKIRQGPALAAAPGSAVRLRVPVFTGNSVDGKPTQTPVSVAPTTDLSADPAFQAHNSGTGNPVWSDPIQGPDAALLPDGAPQRFMDIRAVSLAPAEAAHPCSCCFFLRPCWSIGVPKEIQSMAIAPAPHSFSVQSNNITLTKLIINIQQTASVPQ
jgi:hypothetical protein